MESKKTSWGRSSGPDHHKKGVCFGGESGEGRASRPSEKRRKGAFRGSLLCGTRARLPSEEKVSCGHTKEKGNDLAALARMKKVSPCRTGGKTGGSGKGKGTEAVLLGPRYPTPH